MSHPERGTVTLPGAYVKRHVELGWAVTGYGNQGDTVDVGLAVLEAGTTRNHTYVALTRGRRSNHALIPDPTGTIDPVNALTGMITLETDSSSALATHARLHRQAGLMAPALEAVRKKMEPSVPRSGRPERSGDKPVQPDPGLDDRVRAMQNRLDRLEQRATHSVDRGLSR